jgi:phosphatidylserine/phosphatidylglycerophosphate/cardiolipin synthase-like enzyme
VQADYRVAPATDVKDPIGVWEKELNKAGFAVTHSKFVVINPFSDGCAVVTGSHNLGFQASYNNDENMAIIKGHRPLAEAYAANALDIYDHHGWRWWLAQESEEGLDVFGEG